VECRRPPRRPCVNSLSRSWDVSEAKRGRGGGCDNAAFFFQNLRAWRHRVFICRAPPEIQKFGKVCSKGKVQRDSKVSVFSIIFLFVVCSGTSNKDNARRRILGRGKGLKGCIGRYHEPFQVCPSCQFQVSCTKQHDFSHQAQINALWAPDQNTAGTGAR